MKRRGPTEDLPAMGGLDLEPGGRLGTALPARTCAPAPPVARARPRTSGGERGPDAVHHLQAGPQGHQLARRALAQGARPQPGVRGHEA
eukprot:7906730-Alexandrium_andersonii.AAC.1